MAYKTYAVTTANLDAAAHAAGDTLFLPVAVQALSKGFRFNQNRALLRALNYSISAAIDVLPVFYFFSGNVTLGDVNQPFNLTYADSLKLIGKLTPPAALAIGAGRTWSFPAANDVLNIPLRADNGNTFYIAAATTGSPTPGASCTSRLTLTVEYLNG